MGVDWLPTLGLKEVKDKRIVFKLLAEMIGTMVLVFFSCGSAENDGGMNGGGANIVRFSLTFGFTVATMAQCIGHVSGCHINPAVTIGLLVGRKIGLIASLLYIIFQCIGALIGAALLLAVSPANREATLGFSIPGVTQFSPGLNAGQAFLIEFVITFVLVLTAYAAAADDGNEVKGSPPLAIGLAIAIAHLFAGPLTGPSMNPARSFGPAIVSGITKDLWVYWLGPICGGVVGAITYLLAFQAKTFKEYSLPDNQIGMK